MNLDAPLGRSLLFIPGNRERFFDKAPALPVDAYIVDLEDGVPAAEKASARELARRRVGDLGGRVWVRVNGIGTEELEADLDCVVGLTGISGLILPKAEGPDMVRELDAQLGALERRRGLTPLTTPVIAMIESAVGVLRTYDMVTISDRVVSVCCGGARDGDLQADLGSGWSIDGPELLHARQHILLSARAAGVAWPLDGVFADVADGDGFRRDCNLSRSLGYRGRTVIHPGQVAATNEAYSPTTEELDYYHRVIDAFQRAEADGQATTTVDGRLIDYAMVRNARRWLMFDESLHGRE